MTLFKRSVQLVVVVALLLFLAACSGGSDSAAEPGAVSPDPAATVEMPEEPAGAPNPSPTAAAETTMPAADVQPAALAVDLWYPRVNNHVLHDDVSREIDLTVHQTTAEQIDAVIELWIAGATEAESDAGVIDFDYLFEYCGERFEVGIVDDRAIVTLCDRYGYDGRIGTSLEKTLIEAGLVAKVAVLAADGQKCIGEPTEADAEDPLWCLDDQDRLIDAFRCPINRATSTAVIAGVEEWANARLTPSLDGQIAAELRLGQLLAVYPSTLTYDGTDHWWITAELFGKGRCGSIAAHLLDGTFGNYGDVLPGVSFDLPTTGTWVFGERESVFDRTSWNLQESFATGLSLQFLDGTLIDQLLEDRKRSFDQLGYEFDGDWFDEVVVPGGDRAVRYRFVSESGDSGVDVLLTEFDGFTLSAVTSVYVEDVAPNDELDAFLNSISIDRQAFNNAFAGVDATQVELHGNSYVVVSEVAPTTYSEQRACGTPNEYYVTNEFGERRLAGRLITSAPSELAEDYLLWEIYCEGADPVIFAVARVEDDGSIVWQGTVYPPELGVRGEFGSHTVNDDGSITFSGTQFGGDETFTDTFTLDDLLDNLPTGD